MGWLRVERELGDRAIEIRHVAKIACGTHLDKLEFANLGDGRWVSMMEVTVGADLRMI